MYHPLNDHLSEIPLLYLKTYIIYIFNDNNYSTTTKHYVRSSIYFQQLYTYYIYVEYFIHELDGYNILFGHQLTCTPYTRKFGATNI